MFKQKFAGICLLLSTILLIGLSISCNSYSHESIDKTIVGQLTAVTREGNYSVLNFRDGTSITVSNSSLSHWKMEPFISGAGTWVFNLHTVNSQTGVYYDIVDINDNVPLGGPTTTQPPSNTSTGLPSSSPTSTSIVSLSSIKVEGPSAQSLGVGYTLQFRATGVYANGSTIDITSKVIWTSANQDVASISSEGTAAGITIGTTKITASLGGVISPEVTLTVYNETRPPITP